MPGNRRAILSEAGFSCQEGRASGGLWGTPLFEEVEEFCVEFGLSQDRKGPFTQGLMPELIWPAPGDRNERDGWFDGVLWKRLENLSPAIPGIR